MKTREEIHTEYIETYNKSVALRQELERIDAIDNKAENDKYIGKYVKSDWEISRIDRFDYADTMFYGTTIYRFSDGNIEIKFNCTIFNPKEYTEATKEEFDAEIAKVRTLLEKE